MPAHPDDPSTVDPDDGEPVAVALRTLVVALSQTRDDLDLLLTQVSGARPRHPSSASAPPRATSVGRRSR